MKGCFSSLMTRAQFDDAVTTIMDKISLDPSLQKIVRLQIDRAECSPEVKFTVRKFFADLIFEPTEKQMIEWQIGALPVPEIQVLMKAYNADINHVAGYVLAALKGKSRSRHA